jgi:glycosyltransferase involved in cell wall biosynthesis
MKIIILNTSDNEGGGAARATYRLHQGLNSVGVNSKMLVQQKMSDDSSVLVTNHKTGGILNKLRPSLDPLPLKFYKKRTAIHWGVSWLSSNIDAQIKDLDPDLVHLNWICSGFIPSSILPRIKKPLVWTLHDSWPFTGGCNIPFNCIKYQQKCGSCPQLGSNQEIDISRWLWAKKKKCWKNLNLTIIAPSKWLANCAKTSSLFRNFRIEVIPNGINTNQYRPIGRQLARNILGLDKEKKYLLFGAFGFSADPNKGLQYLAPAVQRLADYYEWKDNLEILVFGGLKSPNSQDFHFKTTYFGKLHDDISLNMLYSAVDVFIAPSMQENLPNTIMEALACGTPCVAFNIGGIPDLIKHQETGYLASPYKIEDLAYGINWVLSDSSRWLELSTNARKKVENEYKIEIIANRYKAIYQEIISNLKVEN